MMWSRRPFWKKWPKHLGATSISASKPRNTGTVRQGLWWGEPRGGDTETIGFSEGNMDLNAPTGLCGDALACWVQLSPWKQHLWVLETDIFIFFCQLDITGFCVSESRRCTGNSSNQKRWLLGPNTGPSSYLSLWKHIFANVMLKTESQSQTSTH